MVALVEILPLLVALACLLLAAILSVFVTALIRAIAGLVGKVPYLGDAIVSGLDSIEHAIWHALGVAFQGVDKLIGAMLHADARLLDYTWNTIKRNAALAAHMAEVVGGHIYDVSGLRGLVHRLEQAWHGIEHGIRTLTKEYHGIDRRLTKLEHELAAGIGHDLRIEVAGLEKEVGNLESKVIPKLRSAVNTAEGDVTALEQWVKSNALLAGTTALTGAVAWALGQLGLGGLSCNTLLNSLANRGCGLWKGLEDLLGLFFDAVLFADLCQVLPEAVALFGEVEAPLTTLISDAANAACAQPPAAWPFPVVAAGPLPPAQSLGQLAA